MPYVENMTVHDADSHIMELPDCLDPYLAAADRAALRARLSGGRKQRSENRGWVDEVVRKQEDAAFRGSAPENIMLRKQYEALGAFRKEDRAAAVDALGFASQLVFTTSCLGNFGLDHSGEIDLCYAAAEAHNRMMADFCSVDPRLLATAYVPLADCARAASTAEDALRLGAKALMIPSRCPKGHGPSHADLDRLWAIAQEAGRPILFHVGGEERMNPDYARNGGPPQLDWLGGAENFSGLSFIAIPTAVMQTMAALIFDGVLDRFPRLQFAAIELGASWLPSWMRFMDSAFEAFGKEERMQRLSGRPSELVRRQFKATPYCHEDAGWIIRNAGEEVALFSSDYPHREGGRNPMKRFEDSLAGLPASTKRRFYRDNFIELMGAGLDVALYDGQPLAA